jgi:hypothetical protein
MIIKHIQAAAILLASLLFNTSALHAGGLPDGPNRVLEVTGKGLARLDVRFSIQGKEFSSAELKGEKGLVVGGVTLPTEGAADYEITAYDDEGRVSNYGKGSIPALGEGDRPVVLPLPPTGDSDGLAATLTSERIVLSVKPGEANQFNVRFDLLDPLGGPIKIDPLEIRYGLTDGRDLRLVPDPRDPGLVVVVPNKGVIPEKLCATPPDVYVCLPNGHCRPIPICSDPYTTISAGANHTCALTQSGLAFCWGLNDEGQLGAATTTSCSPTATFNSSCNPKPLAVTCPTGAPCRFTQISAGTTLTAAIDTNGDAWWWGRGGIAHHKVTASLLGSPVKFELITAGFGHACAISQTSELWCWGTNAFGESGLPAGTPYEVPDWFPNRVLVPFQFKKVAAGGEHTCAIGKSGTDVMCFGRNDSLVNQTKGTSFIQYPAGTGQFYFQQFGGLTSILDVAASAESSCVTLPWGVQCWGRHVWTNVAPFAKPDHLTAGEGQVCTLLSQLASCVGTNNWGELGTGTAISPTAPVPVKAPPPLYAALSAGASHTCGVTPDGNAYCWGNNLSGQVGNGGTAYSVKDPTLVVKP